MKYLAGLVWLVAGIAACANVGEAPHAASSDQDAKLRWQEILSEEGSWPADRSVHDLAVELAGFAASPDPVLRDEIGYEVSARWIGSGRLSLQDLRELLQLHLANLQRGLGEGAGDGVFLRSFSALHLSLLVARDRHQAFLGADDLAQLVPAVALLLSEERDRRGWVEGKGWAHPIAHGADLARFLARHRLLDAPQAATLFGAIEAGLEGPNAWGENDRLAAAAQSLLVRDVFDAAIFDARCGAWVEDAGAVWQARPFDPQLFRRTENRKQFLRALYVRLDSEQQANDRSTRIAQRSLATLAGMP